VAKNWCLIKFIEGAQNYKVNDVVFLRHDSTPEEKPHGKAIDVHKGFWVGKILQLRAVARSPPAPGILAHSQDAYALASLPRPIITISANNLGGMVVLARRNTSSGNKSF